MNKLQKNKYKKLVDKISEIFDHARANGQSALNIEMLKGYWLIGRYIIEFEQAGKLKAEYGKQLINNLSKDLRRKYGKGFSRTNLFNIRKFYALYPSENMVSDKLSWSHYIELLTIGDELERNFYQQQCLLERWTVAELQRQKETSLFQRIALSKDKDEILQLSKQGNKIKTQDDLIRNPYIFEFAGLPENNLFTETDLETKLLDNLQSFLLELGKGFAFIGRQYRITLDNTHYYVDLVFYHYILKCFVLIDLKTKKVKHHDISQMTLYLNYFAKEENNDDDNEPIGIILTKEHNEIMVEYATATLSNKLSVAKYQLYLPDKKTLENRIKEIMNTKE